MNDLATYPGQNRGKKKIKKNKAMPTPGFANIWFQDENIFFLIWYRIRKLKYQTELPLKVDTRIKEIYLVLIMQIVLTLSNKSMLWVWRSAGNALKGTTHLTKSLEKYRENKQHTKAN